MNIRNAVREDVPAMVGFNMAMAWETEEYKLDEKVLTSGVNSVLDDPNRGFYLVAEVEGKVVGSLMVTTEWSDWRNGVFWWVQSVYVTPEHRRSGVFKAMYEQVRQQAKNTMGVCGCRLYVERDNTAAQATYTKLGFVETKYRMFEEPF